MKNKRFYFYISIMTAFLFALCSLSLYADDFVTYEFENNTCYIEGEKYATLKTENQCYYGALSISDRQNDVSFWQSWLREFDNQTQNSFSALAQQVYDLVLTGKADNLFLDTLKQAYKNDSDKNFATVQTYLTDLLSNGSNKNYYTNNDYTNFNNYSITNTINKYDTVNNTYYDYINNISYNYNNTNYNYEINNYTYNTYRNEYVFNTTNNQTITYINNYNNTTIIDNSGSQNLYYRLPDGSNSLNLTEETALNGYKTSLSVASYSNTYDSDNLEFLYHFDGNEYNSAYPKSVNLSFTPNSVEYISSANFDQALVLSENVNINIDKSNLFYSFRLNPRIQDKFILKINGTQIASRVSQIKTTYDFVEWKQTTTTTDKSSFTMTGQTTSYNYSCTSISGYNKYLISNVYVGNNPNGQALYNYSCLYTSNSNITSSTNQRTYNIINNKLYLDDGTRYINYNQWNYISILKDGSVYINGIDTGIDINNAANLSISIDQDGVSYIDEFVGFNENRSTISPSLPYDTNLAYVLPSVYNEKVIENVDKYELTNPNVPYSYLIPSNFKRKVFFDHPELNNKDLFVIFYDTLDGTFFGYSYKDGNYYANSFYLDNNSYHINFTDNINNDWGKKVFEGYFAGSTDRICLSGKYYNDVSLSDTIGYPIIKNTFSQISYIPKINKEVINNQLTIKSNIYVSGWKFGGIRSSNPDLGEVYIYTDDLGYIKSVQQFNGIEWIEVQASLFNQYEMKWLSAYNFNIFMNDWGSVSSKYQTENSLFNTLFSFLTDKFDSVIDTIKSISINNNNSYTNNIQNEYNINYQNDTNKLINNLKNADNNIDLNSPLYNINTTDKQNLTSLTDTFDVFVNGLNDSGIGFMVLVPIILGLVGLMF